VNADSNRCANRHDPESAARLDAMSLLLPLILRRTTVDLGLYFFGISLKLERGRIAIEDNG
jgi:hypothetical protein